MAEEQALLFFHGDGRVQPALLAQLAEDAERRMIDWKIVRICHPCFERHPDIALHSTLCYLEAAQAAIPAYAWCVSMIMVALCVLRHDWSALVPWCIATVLSRRQHCSILYALFVLPGKGSSHHDFTPNCCPDGDPCFNRKACSRGTRLMPHLAEL